MIRYDQATDPSLLRRVVVPCIYVSIANHTRMDGTYIVLLHFGYLVSLAQEALTFFIVLCSVLAARSRSLMKEFSIHWPKASL